MKRGHDDDEDVVVAETLSLSGMPIDVLYSIFTYCEMIDNARYFDAMHIDSRGESIFSFACVSKECNTQAKYTFFLLFGKMKIESFTTRLKRYPVRAYNTLDMIYYNSLVTIRTPPVKEMLLRAVLDTLVDTLFEKISGNGTVFSKFTIKSAYDKKALIGHCVTKCVDIGDAVKYIRDVYRYICNFVDKHSPTVIPQPIDESFIHSRMLRVDVLFIALPKPSLRLINHEIFQAPHFFCDIELDKETEHCI